VDIQEKILINAEWSNRLGKCTEWILLVILFTVMLILALLLIEAKEIIPYITAVWLAEGLLFGLSLAIHAIVDHKGRILRQEYFENKSK